MPYNPREFMVDTYLTTTAQGFDRTNGDGVAYRACTPIPVMLQTGKFKTYNRGDWFRDQVRTRPLGGEAELINYGTGEGTYNTQEFALGYRIDDRERANNAIQIPINENARDILALQHAIKRSRYFATGAMTTGVWSVDITGVSGAPGSAIQVKQWNDATSTPYDDIEAQRERISLATGFVPNVLVLGQAAYLKLRRHPQLTALAGSDQPKIVTDELMRAYFQVDDVVVARAVYNSAMEGAADNYSYVVNSKSALLLYRNPTPASTATRTAMAIFGWNGLLPGQTNEDGTVMGWDRIPLAFSDQLTARAAWDMKILDNTLGCFFNSVVA